MKTPKVQPNTTHEKYNEIIVLTGLGLTSTAGEATTIGPGTVNVTGIGMTASLGDETATGTIEQGWGRGSWGNRAWGDTYSVLPTGVQGDISVGSVGIVADSIHELIYPI